MASGSFNVTTNNSNIAGKIVWNSTSNIEGNYSLVSATLYLSRTNSGYTTSGNGTWSMNINGDSTSVSKQVSLTYNSNTTIISQSNVRVAHNGDGSKQCTISVTGGIPDTSYSATYGSSNVSLDTIPRASDIITFNNFTIGDNIPVKLDTKSASFTNNIIIVLNGNPVVTRNNVPDNYTFVLTEAEQDKIYSLTPNVVSTQVTLWCHTYNGGTFVGQSSKVVTATVGANIVPTFNSISATDTVTNVATTVGKFVQSLSKIKCTINGASGTRYSTIKDYDISVFTDGVADYYAVYREQSVILNEFSFSGNINIKGTITDSRGRQASKTITITLLPYALPRITTFTVTRATSSGVVDNLGTYAKLTSVGSVASLINATEKNTLTYTLYARKRGTESWGIPIKTTTTTVNLNATNNLGIYAITNAWEFRLDVTDKFKTTMSVVTMSTSQVTMSWGKAGVGVGKILEKGALDVAGDIYTNGLKVLTDNVRVGGVNIYPNSAQTMIRQRTILLDTWEMFEGHVGETVTISFDMKASISRELSIYGYQSNGVSIVNGSPEMPTFKFTPKLQFQRFEFTTKIKDWGYNNPQWTRGAMAMHDSAGDNTLTMQNMQIEFGDFATSYAESPKDVRIETDNNSYWKVYLPNNMRMYASMIEIGKNNIATSVYPSGFFTSILPPQISQVCPNGNYVNYSVNGKTCLIDWSPTQCRVTNYDAVLTARVVILTVGRGD